MGEAQSWPWLLNLAVAQRASGCAALAKDLGADDERENSLPFPSPTTPAAASVLAPGDPPRYASPCSTLLFAEHPLFLLLLPVPNTQAGQALWAPTSLLDRPSQVRCKHLEVSQVVSVLWGLELGTVVAFGFYAFS